MNFFLLGFLFITIHSGCLGDEINFEQLAANYVKCVENEYKSPAKWYDMYSKKPFFEVNERYKKYKVEAILNKTSEKERLILDTVNTQVYPTQIDINNSPVPMKIVLRETMRLMQTEKIKKENNLALSAELTVSGQVSFVSAELKVGYEHESHDAETEYRRKTKETQTLRQYVVGPYTEASASTTLVRKTKQSKVEYDTVLEGYIAIAFSDYVNPNTNYQKIQDLDESIWKKCGTGLTPVDKVRGVYFVPIGVLADGVNLMKARDDALIHKTLVDKEEVKDSIQFHVRGVTDVAKKGQAFSKLCPQRRRG